MHKCLLVFALLFVGTNCLLLITGTVTNNSVRILYEASNQTEIRNQIVVLKNLKNSKETQTKKIHLELKPKIIIFKNLSENSEFKVFFGENDFVSFRTFSNKQQKKLKLLVTSCDRYVDDRDEDFYKKLLEKDSDYDVVLHLGDQIYADIIGKNLTTEQSYEYVLEEYRKLYRLTWDTPVKREFLRSGSHLMIPDDHDITNNVDALLLNTKFKKLLLAGRQAFYEYQYQLIGDIYDEAGNLLVDENFDKLKRTYEFNRIGNIGLGLLDTRFQRTFELDEDFRLLGKEQFDLLTTQLEEWKNDETIDHILICTGTPLGFFSPFMSKLAYTFENPKETYPSHPLLIRNLIKIFELLKHHPKVKLISGDVHQFVKSKICDKSNHCIDQLISSGISKGSAVISELKLVLFFAVGKHFTEQKFGNWKMHHDEQMITNNYGVIEIEQSKLNWHGVFRETDQMEIFKIFIFENLSWILYSQILIFLFSFFICCRR